MTSVRLRLLILALMPLIVLMPLLMVLGLSRWTADYDELLIAKVESDLRIAEQYLARLLEGTETGLEAMAASTGFAEAMARGPVARARYFADMQAELGLDFLYHLPADRAGRPTRWPVIASALAGRGDTRIDVFAPGELGPELAARARIDLIDTEAAHPTDRRVEDRGLVIHSAAPVRLAGHEGALVGGILLNRNLQFIDTINALVYLNAVTGGTRQGTATLFLDDVRISTNVRLFEDRRALGTRVSGAVRNAVLGQGRTWLDRAFVVNDWYVSGYLPLSDSFGSRVGMLYVGFLEAPFTARKRAAILAMLVAFLAVLAISAPIFLSMAKSIFAPLERMTQTMARVGRGDLSARNGDVGSRDEIGQVAGHLDRLIDQVQQRDRELRAWADELNARVEDRTAALRAANRKLESTFRQLVMSEKLASIGEITAGVAHEINNPVAVIQGNVDVMRETLGARGQAVATELDLIDRQVGRIAVIVGKLLQFARPGEFTGDDRTVYLPPVVEDCLVLVDHVLSRKKIAVETDLADVPRAQVDAGEMQQVVINLVINAAQAMGESGRLYLSLRPETRDGIAGVTLTVRDTGPGIAEDKLPRLFDPFFTTKTGEGTGLGLSISQSLIQRAGGLITARNPAGGGAEFTVWLPAADTAGQAG